jgi:hypothetical protein
VKAKKVMHVAWLSFISVTPSALIFGYFTWWFRELWYSLVAIHALAFVGATVLFSLPEEKQLGFIKAFARMAAASSKNPTSESSQIVYQLEELERKEKKSTRD